MVSCFKRALSFSLLALTLSCGQNGVAPLSVGSAEITGTTSLYAGIPGTSGVTNGSRLSAKFSSITGLGTDGTNIYVHSYSDGIRKITPNGNVTTVGSVSGDTFGAVYLGGYVYYGDNTTAGGANGLHRINVSTGVDTLVTGVPGAVLSVTTDGTNIFCVGNQTRVYKVTYPGHVVTTLTGGAAGYADGASNVAKFRLLKNIVYAEGYLWASDTSSITLRKIHPSTGYVTTVAGADQQAANADGVGTAARFDGLSYLGYHGGAIFLIDSGNGLLKRYTIATGEVTTLAGQYGVWGSTMGSPSQTTFGSSGGPFLSLNGTLYYGDESEFHVRIIE